MKIFGIGLPRSGTSSLNRALQLLGYRAKHFPHIEEEIKNGNYHLTILETYDALTDAPVVPIFAQLDTAYPGSKFILTIRGLDDWLRSCEQFFNEQDREITNHSEQFRDMLFFYRVYVFGRHTFHRERWAYVYELHHSSVTRHFQGRPDDLLRFNIRTGDGWAQLCPFLQRPVPTCAFPYVNAFERRVQNAGNGFAGC